MDFGTGTISSGRITSSDNVESDEVFNVFSHHAWKDLPSETGNNDNSADESVKDTSSREGKRSDRYLRLPR
jgi:hypothetical protein